MDERRKKILSDRTVHDAIRGVARQRGVPTHDVDEILDAVIEAAMDNEKLPLDDPEEAKTYLCAIARNKSIDEARSRNRFHKRYTPVDPGEELPASESPGEQKAFAERLLREGRARFPRTFGWFWRTSMQGESHVAIAAELNVSPAHVRHEVYLVRKGMQRFIATVAVVVLLIIVGRRWWGPGAIGLNPNDLVSAPPSSTAESEERQKPPVNYLSPEERDIVAGLRATAHQKAQEKNWKECWEAYFVCEKADPEGAKPEQVAEATRCKEELDKQPVTPP
jgi:DNA-directed RNA polymerase specialized sigma24 family protein